MISLIIMLLVLIGMLVYYIIGLKKENKILYSNYQAALLVIGDYDSDLKKYLESEQKK